MRSACTVGYSHECYQLVAIFSRYQYASGWKLLTNKNKPSIVMSSLVSVCFIYNILCAELFCDVLVDLFFFFLIIRPFDFFWVSDVREKKASGSKNGVRQRSSFQALAFRANHSSAARYAHRTTTHCVRLRGSLSGQDVSGSHLAG